MNKAYRKLFTLFLIIVLIPTLIFSIYEIGSLRNNEKIINEIYDNQLQTILFSINQYSDDVFTNIVRDIEYAVNEREGVKEVTIQQLIQNNPIVLNFFCEKPDTFHVFPSHRYHFFKRIPGQYEDIYERLGEYISAGYRKIETVPWKKGNEVLLLFCLEAKEEVYNAGIVLDAKRFVKEELDSKIQQIGQNEFVIAMLDSNNSVIYESDNSNEKIEYNNLKQFWIFENYNLGIHLKGQTIEELVNERVKRNLILILLVDSLLLLGAALVFKNIKKNIELAQLKSDFVSNVSHEIRTPLALINMYVETLEMNRVKNDEKRQEYYKILLNETKRLSGMVNKILNFSQIERGNKQYSFTSNDLNELVLNVLETYGTHLKAKGFEYNVSLHEDLPMLNIDPEAVTDAFINLIDNAIKYSGETKKIEIKTGRKLITAFIEVRDHGIGISEKNKKLIFEKFYRVTDGNLAHKAKGTGLGLTIVSHIMEAHKGKIELDSVEGKGSRFRLHFLMPHPDVDDDN